MFGISAPFLIGVHLLAHIFHHTRARRRSQYLGRALTELASMISWMEADVPISALFVHHLRVCLLQHSFAAAHAL